MTDSVALHHGDCLVELPKLSAGGVALIFADLPYASVGRQVTANAWDVGIDLAAFWAAAKPLLAKRGWAVFTADLPHAARLYASYPKGYRHDVVWQKLGRLSGFLHARHAPLRAHELMLAFAKQQGTYNPQKTAGAPHDRHKYKVANPAGTNFHAFTQRVKPNLGTRHPTSILPIARVTGKQQHPTQKPVALLEWIIRTYTNPGDLVVDPAMGSGVTGVACAALGRRFVGIEKDAVYFAQAQKSILAACEQGPRLPV